MFQYTDGKISIENGNHLYFHASPFSHSIKKKKVIFCKLSLCKEHPQQHWSVIKIPSAVQLEQLSDGFVSTGWREEFVYRIISAINDNL